AAAVVNPRSRRQAAALDGGVVVDHAAREAKTAASRMPVEQGRAGAQLGLAVVLDVARLAAVRVVVGVGAQASVQLPRKAYRQLDAAAQGPGFAGDRHLGSCGKDQKDPEDQSERCDDSEAVFLEAALSHVRSSFAGASANPAPVLHGYRLS